jgi:putative Mg2+ transporter-C (MgtC) family protein
MNPELSTSQIVLRVAFALLLGFIVGLEREAKNKPAGLRTNMLVSLGAAAFTMLALEIYYSILNIRDRVTSDPLRILNGIMEGLGFLGAGCIIQARGSVAGITTAATIWVVGAIGLACGAGEFRIAVITTMMAFVVLTALRFVEGKIKRAGAGPETDGERG